ncbi:MAG: hypothetical protein ACI361_04240 [Atopobiaceae bacterium]
MAETFFNIYATTAMSFGVIAGIVQLVANILIIIVCVRWLKERKSK